MVVGLHVDGPDEASLAFAFAEAARRAARVQVVAAYVWPLQMWAVPGDFITTSTVDQEAIETGTRMLADGFVTPHRERYPDVRVEVLVRPGDAAGHLNGGENRLTALPEPLGSMTGWWSCAPSKPAHRTARLARRVGRAARAVAARQSAHDAARLRTQSAGTA